MSKLLDKLNQVSRGSTQPMGFRKAATQKSPRMVLIAALGEGDDRAAAEAKESADAVLIEGAGSQIASSLGEVPWGVSLAEVNEKELSQLKKTGCDFLVFDTEKAPLTLLEEEGLGKIAEVEPSLADGLIRAIGQLPIDAVLVGGEVSLSVHRLMVCQHLANLVRKPLVVLAPLGMSKEDLNGLWEAGMSGVMVKVEGGAKEELSGLRQAIDTLPPSRRVKERVEASLPYPGGEEITPVEEEEE